MFFNRKILIFLTILFIGGCSTSKTDNYADLNSLHRPSMNPGGKEFGSDVEFCKSYNKLQCVKEKNCRKVGPSCSLKPCSSCNAKVQKPNISKEVDECGLPQGATLISSHKTKDHKNDENWYNANCVENNDLPDDLQEIVSARCNKIMKEMALPKLTTTTLNSGKSILCADSIMDDIDIMDYQDAPKVKCNGKDGKCNGGAKKKIIKKKLKKKNC